MLVLKHFIFISTLLVFVSCRVLINRHVIEESSSVEELEGKYLLDEISSLEETSTSEEQSSQKKNVENETDSDVGLNVLQIIQKYDYPLELHDIETQDAYILQLHRIPNSGQSAQNPKAYHNQLRPAVLLVHCFLCSSAEWIYMGPGKSLGFILADEGYDVWIGNNRGNTWSRRHKFLDPDDTNGPFWDYSWHEMGYYDLPAMIDHILATTGQEKLYIIGHSQGTVTPTVMFSTRPEYNKKVKLFSAFSPAIHFSTEPMFKTLFVSFWSIAAPVMRLLGTKEFIPKGELMSYLAKTFCSKNSITLPICTEILYTMTGRNPEQFDESKVAVIGTNNPSGSSWKTTEHFKQIGLARQFQQYDYGETVNLRKYGTKNPPKYDIGVIDVPVAIYYAKADTFVGAEGVVQFSKELPNLALLYEVSDPNFGHVDFIWANNAPKVLYNQTLELMKKYS